MIRHYLETPGGTRYNLEEQVITIGRSPQNTINIPDKTIEEEIEKIYDEAETEERLKSVSRKHARINISETPMRTTITDLGSKNGTQINRGRKMNPRTSKVLQDADRIRFGGIELIYHEEGIT